MKLYELLQVILPSNPQLDQIEVGFSLESEWHKVPSTWRSFFNYADAYVTDMWGDVETNNRFKIYICIQKEPVDRIDPYLSEKQPGALK